VDLRTGEHERKEKGPAEEIETTHQRRERKKERITDFQRGKYFSGKITKPRWYKRSESTEGTYYTSSVGEKKEPNGEHGKGKGGGGSRGGGSFMWGLRY